LDFSNILCLVFHVQTLRPCQSASTPTYEHGRM
jgi:hypothetical protein